jgi:hypothetical protein
MGWAAPQQRRRGLLGVYRSAEALSGGGLDQAVTIAKMAAAAAPPIGISKAAASSSSSSHHPATQVGVLVRQFSLLHRLFSRSYVYRN